MSTLRRTLVELCFYPPHEPRKASSEYRKVHHHLIYDLDTPCWRCGVRHSTGGAMETHHAVVEVAAVNGVDFDTLAADYPELRLLLRQANGETLDAAEERAIHEFIDGEGGLLVLCAACHRSPMEGVHEITYPAWVLRRFERPDWHFTPESKEATHE